MVINKNVPFKKDLTPRSENDREKSVRDMNAVLKRMRN